MYRGDNITMRPETTSCRRVLLDDTYSFPAQATAWQISVELLENLRCLPAIEQQMINSCEDSAPNDGDSLLILSLENFYSVNDDGEEIKPAAKELVIHADEPLIVEVARNQIPLKIKVSGQAVLSWVSPSGE